MVEGILCRRGVQSVWLRAVWAGEQCRGYGIGQYVQKSVKYFLF